MKKSSRFQVAGCTSRRRAGLTLIEVILALMIIGTGLVALVAAVSRCLAIPRLAVNFDTARELLGQLEAEEPLQGEEDIEDAAGSGTFDSPHSNFSWERTVEQEGEDEEDGLWRVTTTIRWTENNRARSEEVVTLVYRVKKS
jgi:prepilin-type N-terminal cleavage/methylation domain-containing protein